MFKVLPVSLLKSTFTEHKDDYEKRTILLGFESIKL